MSLTCHRPWQFVGSVPGFCWFLSPLATCGSGPGHSPSGCRGNISLFSDWSLKEWSHSRADWSPEGCWGEGGTGPSWAWGRGGGGGQASAFDPGVPPLHLVHLLDLPSHLLVFIPRSCCLVSSIKPSGPSKQGSHSFPKALETPPPAGQARGHVWTQEGFTPEAPDTAGQWRGVAPWHRVA